MIKAVCAVCALCALNSTSHAESVVTILKNLLQISTIRYFNNTGIEGMVTFQEALKALSSNRELESIHKEMERHREPEN